MNIGIISKAKGASLKANGLLGWFGLSVVAVASFTIAINSFEQVVQGNFYFSSLCFLLMFIIALVTTGKIALTVFIFLIPLLPTLNAQLATFGGISSPSLPMAGSDLVAGYFLGFLSKQVIYSFALQNIYSLRAIRPPWPINIVLLVVTFSTALAILRNNWASASSISFNAIPFSLINFREISWFDDLRPLTDWMAYAAAAGSFLLAVHFLKFSKNRSSLVYRPLLGGLFLSGILAIVQSKTGMGFEQLPIYRDILGYAPYGFRPDLHAYAGYTLLGAIGLWGYYSTIKVKFERAFILLVIVLSWYGLIASISKSSIFFALFASIVGFFWWIFYAHQKNFFRLVLKMALLILALSSLLLLAIMSDLVSAPNWLIYLYQTFSKLHWSNFNEVSAALSQRPAIWLAAIRMWELFPIFGVGQGDFYQLSRLFNFYNVPDLINGENTHNYFLQTLSETGLAGAFCFAIAIFAPFFLVKDRRVLMPAAIGLFSLFLGNIYAHSFLVRENLLLAAVFLGLMYSYVPQEKLALSPYRLLKTWKPNFSWNWVVPIAFLAFLGLGVREIYTSFYRFPFEYGSACFVNKPLSEDRWSSGLYEIPLPIGSHGVQLPIRVARPNIQNIPLSATLEIVDSGKQVLASQSLVWSKEGPEVLKISLPNGGVVSGAGIKASLKLSSCWTPRNLGISIDGRRLGVLVDSPIID